jgi:hypothetical protein
MEMDDNVAYGDNYEQSDQPSMCQFADYRCLPLCVSVSTERMCMQKQSIKRIVRMKNLSNFISTKLYRNS